MSRNKEYRLKRKSLRKDYIIQDKNLTIKTLYYRNETKRNKIEQLEQENKQLKEIEKEHQKINGELREENKKLKEVIEEVREYIEDWLFNVGGNGASMTYEDINEILQILDKATKENK